MNNLTPGYLLPFVMIGTLATVAAVLFGLHRALKLAGWPTRDRRRAVSIGAVLLVGWFFAALLPSWSGFYRTARAGIPAIQYGLLIPIIAGVALFWRWGAFRRAIEAVPQEWLVGVQFYRAEGLIFLLLLAGHRLPGVFAWPAGVGDVIVGLLAPAVGVAYANSLRNSGALVRVWNLLGIGDLIVAVATGFLSSPSRFQMFAFGAPNMLVTAFPLVMIPVFLVPLSILLHLASLKKLRQTETRPQAPDEGTAATRSCESTWQGGIVTSQ
jgi:hypothetical protein